MVLDERQGVGPEPCVVGVEDDRRLGEQRDGQSVPAREDLLVAGGPFAMFAGGEGLLARPVESVPDLVLREVKLLGQVLEPAGDRQDGFSFEVAGLRDAEALAEQLRVAVVLDQDQVGAVRETFDAAA